MKVADDTVVSFHYTLKHVDGGVIESSQHNEPMAVLIGHRNILPALEEALQGKTTGESFSVTLPPEKAYGLRRENTQQRVPIKHLMTKGKIKPGMQVAINTEQGARHVTVIKVGKFNVDVDTNHPLAGQTLVFDLTIADVREASAEEKSHGHAHGIGGHHH